MVPKELPILHCIWTRELPHTWRLGTSLYSLHTGELLESQKRKNNNHLSDTVPQDRHLKRGLKSIKYANTIRVLRTLRKVTNLEGKKAPPLGKAYNYWASGKLSREELCTLLHWSLTSIWCTYQASSLYTNTGSSVGSSKAIFLIGAILAFFLTYGSYDSA